MMHLVISTMGPLYEGSDFLILFVLRFLVDSATEGCNIFA